MYILQHNKQIKARKQRMRQKLLEKQEKKKQNNENHNNNTNIQNTSNSKSSPKKSNNHNNNSNKNNKQKSKNNKRGGNKKRNKNNGNNNKKNKNNHNHKKKHKNNSKSSQIPPSPTLSNTNTNNNKASSTSSKQASLPPPIHIIDDDQESISIPIESESDLSGIFQQIPDSISTQSINLKSMESPLIKSNDNDSSESNNNNNGKYCNNNKIPNNMFGIHTMNHHHPSMTPDEIFDHGVIPPLMANKMGLNLKDLDLNAQIEEFNALENLLSSARNNNANILDSNNSNASKEENVLQNELPDDVEKSQLPASDHSDVSQEDIINKDHDDIIQEPPDRPKTNQIENKQLQTTSNANINENSNSNKINFDASNLQNTDKKSLLKIIQQQTEEINELKRNMNTLSNMVFTMKDNLEDLELNIADNEENKDSSTDIIEIREEIILLKKRLNILETEQTDREQMRDWLRNKVKLDIYYDILIENGFEDMISISKLNKSLLKEIGITKIGHQQKFLHFVDLLNESKTPYQY